MSWTKDPDAVLDFKFDWSGWLAESETITDHAVTASTGITVNSTSHNAGQITAWVAGGDVGKSYTLTCHVETNQGRQDDRSRRITVRDR